MASWVTTGFKLGSANPPDAVIAVHSHKSCGFTASYIIKK